MPLTGREARLAFAKFAANSWGVAASVTKGVYFTSTASMKLEPERVNDEAFGQAFLGRGDLGDVKAPDLAYTGRSRYDDWQYILQALACGSPSVTLSTSATGQVPSYIHQIDLATSTDGLGATFAVDKVLYVDELTSAKVYGFSEKPGSGGVMDISYKVLGSKPTNASTTNTRSTVNGASFPALANRVFRKHGVIRMNAQGGSSLAVGDKLDLEEWSIEFERPQDAPHVFGQDYVFAPADNGFPKVMIKVKYPRMTTTSASSLYAALTANTVWKMDVTFTGDLINSTDSYTRKYQFPAVELDSWDGADVKGADQVKPEASFTAKLAATSPSGMAFVNPLRLLITNSSSSVAF